MGRMGQDLGVKSNLKTGMKLKARKMQNLASSASISALCYRKEDFLFNSESHLGKLHSFVQA